MNRDPADSFYYELLSILRRTRLDWVADQVEAEVGEGRIVEKIRSTGRDYVLEEPTLEPSGTGRGSLGFTSTPFTGQEKLELLLDAVRRAVVEPIQIHEKCFQLLVDGFDGLSLAPGIMFADDEDSQPLVVMRRVGEPLIESEAVDALRQILDQISQQFRLSR